MYICPICSKEFIEEDKLVKHYLACWKSKNPQHKSKNAPRSADVETRNVSDEMKEFFERKKYDGSCS
jgi:hypothetical protein